MPIPEGLKLVAGDVITLAAVVKYDSEPFSGRVHATAKDAYGSAVITERSVATVVSTTIRIGDEVRDADAEGLADHGLNTSADTWPFGIVVAIAMGKAWVEWPLGENIEPVDKLRRVRTAKQVADGEPRAGEVSPAPEAAEPLPAPQTPLDGLILTDDPEPLASASTLEDPGF